MISKQDVILLLTELSKKQGIDVKTDLELVLRSSTIPLSVLKKINDSKPLDIVNFYSKLRRSYNDKKSKLYINIMKSDENIIDDPITIVTTLSALLNQILQFKAEDKPMFFEHARANEITKVLDIYISTYNISPAQKLLELTKADIKCLDAIK